MRIAICEDEQEQQKLLEEIIHSLNLGFAYEIHKFSSGEDLVRAYKNKENFAIIFMDMQLGGMNGIRAVEIIKTYDKKSIIIIVTSILEYAMEGYRVKAFDFVLKPVTKEKINQVFNRAMKQLKSGQTQNFIIETRDKTIAVKLSEVLYLESSKRKVNVICEKETYLSNINITDAEKQLVDRGFARISRYYLVNLGHIKEIGSKNVILQNGESLIIGEKIREQLKTKYLEYRMEEAL